ncbi:GNAT family N-acetyltransferase [Flavobacterium sp.]|jgi:ribosomal protein S18 acetylase RimI-like enzyme|uniref:GNAT family N-acetyltransferase n=1 Tax=Flavobacterium sp. TaxID=239 RepID=UPI0037C14913
MEVNKLKWDSDFFNIKVGEIINPDTNVIVLKGKFDLIYLKSEKNCEAKIEGYVNSFTETKVLFSKLIDQKREINQNVFSISETNFNIDDLYNLAFESGKMSRFNLDKKFGRTKFEKLYVKWVDNSINKIFADDVLIYKENNQTLGFVTYKTENNFATIGLIAVDSFSQGKGIGSKLIDAVENKLISNGVYKLIIPTQLENTNACGFYEKKKYKISQTTVIKHFWKK